MQPENTAGTTCNNASVAHLDHQVLQRVRELDASDNSNFFEQMIDIYLENSVELIEQLRLAISDCDAKALNRQHTRSSPPARTWGYFLGSVMRTP